MDKGAGGLQPPMCMHTKRTSILHACKYPTMGLASLLQAIMEASSSNGPYKPRRGSSAWSLPGDGVEAPPGKRRCCNISTFWVTCLLTTVVCLTCTITIATISVVNGRALGYGLLIENAERQFEALYLSTQAALEEADYWMRYFEEWCRITAVAITPETLEPQMKAIAFPWMTINAERVGGTCAELLDTWGTGNYWMCASRLYYNGTQSLFWEYTNGTTMYKWKVDSQGNLLKHVDTWSVDPSLAVADPDAWRLYKDGEVRWRAPWMWEESRPDGTNLVFTEIGQRRALLVRGTQFTLSLWMQDVDWSPMLTRILNRHGDLSAEDSAAFLFSESGDLIASSCAKDRIVAKGTMKLTHATNSTCRVIRETYKWLVASSRTAQDKFFSDGTIDRTTYVVGMRRITTARGDPTPYYLAQSYPYNRVDLPVRQNVYIIIGTSLVLVLVVVGVASLLTKFLIARPLQLLSRDMYQCVTLDVTSTDHSTMSTSILEIFWISQSFLNMKHTLKAVTRLVPMEVVQQSLRTGKAITVSMAPTEASVMFMDIVGFTSLTETVDTKLLVNGITAFFSELSDIIVRHRGVVDKYIGDCIMSFWNTPESVDYHELLACAAAVKCNEAMQNFIFEGLELKARTGMEAGHVYAGMFGSPYRMNYTVVGDVVNVASRLEGLNKEFGTMMLIGSSMYKGVRDYVNARQMQPFKALPLKGKKEKLVVHELLSMNSQYQGRIRGLLRDEPQGVGSPHSFCTI